MTTTEAITTESVLAAIETDSNTTDWTTRVVLKTLEITDNNRNRKTCRQTLHGLWESGKIKKKPAQQASDLVIYYRNSPSDSD